MTLQKIKDRAMKQQIITDAAAKIREILDAARAELKTNKLAKAEDLDQIETDVLELVTCDDSDWDS